MVEPNRGMTRNTKRDMQLPGRSATRVVVEHREDVLSAEHPHVTRIRHGKESNSAVPVADRSPPYPASR